MSRDIYPNLFEKKCDESQRLQELKGALNAVQDVDVEYYLNSYLPVDERKSEKLEEARRLIQEVINRERGHIGVRLASKYTRNPDHENHSLVDPGVIEEFEEWQPKNKFE